MRFEVAREGERFGKHSRYPICSVRRAIRFLANVFARQKAVIYNTVAQRENVR